MWIREGEAAQHPDNEEGNVLLQVMKIPRLDRMQGYKSVLWDTVCNGMFVRMGQTKR